MSLDFLGLATRAKRNLCPARLYEEAVRRGEGVIADHGPLVCRTGQHTGRSPNDKFLVKEPSSEGAIAWGAVNRPMDPSQFETLEQDILASLQGSDLFVLDCYAGADSDYRLPIRVINEYAWHNLFARNLFIVDETASPVQTPPFTVVAAPSFKADPARHGSRSDVAIALSFAKRLVLIAGTSYAGEMKKSIFSTLNYLLPLQGVLPMHCSANVGRSGDVALFFGLSGTGKTTLSSDPERGLIGDDEHGWSDRGVFNFEGGCYAKTIRLSPEAEPQIYATTRRFGTVLENVVIDDVTRRLNLDDDRLTENTRAAYPISFIDNAVPGGQGGHPQNIVMLTADAFGVLPPLSRLTPDGRHVSLPVRVHGEGCGNRERRDRAEGDLQRLFRGAVPAAARPAATRACWARRSRGITSKVWLLNTGWTGGPYGIGSRMKIGFTRAMIRAALSGALDDVPYSHDPVFNLDVPTTCPDVPTEVLSPRRTWSQAGRVRPPGGAARPDVRRQLQAVRGRCHRRGARRRSAILGSAGFGHSAFAPEAHADSGVLVLTGAPDYLKSVSP